MNQLHRALQLFQMYCAVGRCQMTQTFAYGLVKLIQLLRVNVCQNTKRCTIISPYWRENYCDLKDAELSWEPNSGPPRLPMPIERHSNPRTGALRYRKDKSRKIIVLKYAGCWVVYWKFIKYFSFSLNYEIFITMLLISQYCRLSNQISAPS